MEFRQQLRLPADYQLRPVSARRIHDLSRRAPGRNRSQRVRAAYSKPAKLSFMFAFELCVQVRSRAHESGNDRKDMNAKPLQLRVQPLGKTNRRKFGAAVRNQVRYAYLAPD